MLPAHASSPAVVRLALAATLTACGAAAPPPSPPAPSAAAAPLAPSLAPPLAPPCPAIAGLATALVPGGTLVLGELHGTAEIPRFVGDVACHAAAQGPLTLGLEIPRDEQGRIDAYLASGGDAAARAALLAGAFWQRAYQDGRSSVAMAELLERARALRAAGGDVAVLAFDIVAPTPTRDRAMAHAIAAARRAAPARSFVVLAGNYHSRRTVGAPWDADARWMAWYLIEDGVALTTLDVELAGGSAWVCFADDHGAQTCGAHAMKPRAAGAPWRVEVVAGVEGHDGRYTVGPTRAAPPAIAPTMPAAAE